MRKADGTLKWNFPDVVGGSDLETHYFTPQVEEINTGAKWCGDHGLAMELCKVFFTWDMTFGESNTHMDCNPGGWWKDNGAVVIGATNDETSFVTYNAWLMSAGSKFRLKTEDQLQGQMLAESYLNNTFIIQSGQRNARQVQTEYLTQEWDLTDGAGNGTIIVVPALTIGGHCRYGQSNINRDNFLDKIFKPPISQIVENQMPKTTVALVYKYKRLNVQEWMAYAQSQATNGLLK